MTHEDDNQLRYLPILKMVEANWQSLNHLWLGIFQLYEGQNNIGAKGCKYLSKLVIPQISVIDIGIDGCK